MRPHLLLNIVLIAATQSSFALAGARCDRAFRAISHFWNPPTIIQLAERTGRTKQEVERDYRMVVLGVLGKRMFSLSMLSFGGYIPVVMLRNSYGLHSNPLFAHYSNFFQTMAGSYVVAQMARQLGEPYPRLSMPLNLLGGIGLNYYVEQQDATAWNQQLDTPDVFAGSLGGAFGILLEGVTHRIDMHRLQKRYELEPTPPGK